MRWVLMFAFAFASAVAATWVETSRPDFVDGNVDAQMYVSYRAQLEPDTGCVEFYARFDVDNNGFYDLACSDDSGSYLTLYTGSDSGYFPQNRLRYPVTSGGNVDLADLNLDGNAELIHSGWRSGRSVIYWGTPSGPSDWDTTVLAYAGQGEDVNVYDLDRDGYLDVILGSSDGNLYVYWGSAAGYSSPDRTLVNLGAAIGHNTDIADFDKDGWGDIAVSMWTSNECPVVYWGPGRQPRTIVRLPFRWNNDHGITPGDFNRDEWLDIVFTGYDTVVTSRIYLGSDSGFSPSSYVDIHPGRCYGGSAAADWNGDGRLDLVYLRGNWTNGGRWKPVVYFNQGSPPWFTDANRQDLGIETLNASGGFIADLDFDGDIDIFVNNMEPDDSSYVLWGPGHLARTPLPADNDHHGVFREPGSSYDRAKTAQYYSSVFDPGLDSLVLGGTSSWTAFEPPGSAVTVAYRSGDVPVPDSTWTTFATVSSNGGPLPAQVLGRRYLQYRARFSYDRPCYLPDLEEVTTVIVCTPPSSYDVGVERLLAPGDSVDSGTVTVPLAVARNYGSVAASCPVRFRIGVDYEESTSVTLGPGRSDTVSFPPWTARLVGAFPKLCWTEYEFDENRSNDTCRGTVVVRGADYIDVGPVEILSPKGLVDSGTTHQPAAVVSNFGNRRVAFPVLLSIGSAYRDSVGVSVGPGASETLAFADWTARELGTLAVRCHTALAQDQNRSNDTIRDSVAVAPPPVFDVGPVAILDPAGVLDSGTTVLPRAVVRNFGSEIVSFPVHLSVGGSYQESAFVSVAAQGAETVAFTVPWVAETLGVHVVACRTALVADANRANDTLRASVAVARIRRLDVGPLAVLAPRGVLDSGTQVVPRAAVHNFGSLVADFPVHLLVGAGFRDSVGCRLAPGATDTVSFARWTAPAPGRYAVTCYTRLTGDERPANDTVQDSVSVRLAPARDVGCVAVLAPLGLAVAGDTVRPSARIRNHGGWTENYFDVRMRIGSDYDRKVTVSSPLAPGGEVDVRFPVWLAEVGDHSVVCSTELYLDANPPNDRAMSRVVVGPAPVLLVEADQSDRVVPGTRQVYRFWAELRDDSPGAVELLQVTAPAGWSVELVDSAGVAPLARLDPVVPGLKSWFGLWTESPATGLVGRFDTLGAVPLVVRGRLESDHRVTDTAVLLLRLIPELDIHNYPNPFGDRTTFIIGLPTSGVVSLVVYNRTGELVGRVMERTELAEGVHRVGWDATNLAGRGIARGTYDYVFEYDGVGQDRRIVKKLVFTGE